MAQTLNRFPLLGLWAKEAARRVGYPEADARALGHAYAVLYAIRLRRLTTPKEGKPEREAPPKPAERRRGREVTLGGDPLTVTGRRGQLQGLVGGEEPQTGESYRKNVAAKFPPGYYARLERGFRSLLATYDPAELREGVVYSVYDRWKRRCAVGRLVDLDRLLAWCERERRRRVSRRGS